MKKLDEIRAMREEYKKRLETESQAILAEAFKEVFDAHPEIKAIGWTQYTPYYNDGNPCVFGVGDFSYSEEDVDPSKPGSLYEEPWSESYGRDKGQLAAAVNGLARELPDDVMNAAFGDHVRVIATREGFHTTGYSHD